MSNIDADRKLAALAAKQHGVFSRSQAAGLGFTRAAMRSRLTTRRWIEVHPGVFALTGAPATFEYRLVAALLACGEGAAASGMTAAFLLGLVVDRPGRIDISIPRRRRPRVTGPHVRRVTTLDSFVRRGIRLTTVPQTIVDLATTPLLDAVLDSAIDKRLTSVARMRTYIARLRTNPGLRRLKRLLDDRAKGRLTTELERRFDALLKRSPLPYPTRQHPIGSRFADFAYVEERIVIELDGGDSHMRKDVFEDDRARQNELILHGWTVLRFTWDDVTKRPERVIATIRQMLAMSSKKRAGNRPPESASP